MWKVEFFVEDKHALNVVRDVTGRVLNLIFVPVANASSKGGKVAATSKGDVLSLVMASIVSRKLKQVTNADIVNIYHELGRPINAKTTSYSTISRLEKAKSLKKVGKGVYKVL